MSEWHEATVASTQAAAEGLTSVRLDLTGTPLPGTHSIPGQYVKISIEGVGEGYFAIASPPSAKSSHFDFLIKGGAPLADALVAALPGARVKVSAPAGKGYPLEKARGKNVLLFATGSGISPIHSALQVIRQDRTAYRQVTLYFGARTPQAFAYEKDLTSWEKDDGIQVVRTVSRPGETGWPGLTGYVQSHLREVVVEKDNTVAFICGQKGMVQGVTDALIARGLPRENIFLNF